MTNPTDPRVEAAARALCARMFGPSVEFGNIPNHLIDGFREDAQSALKAADEAAWRSIEGVKDCPLAVLIEQGSDEGPYIGSCRDGVWCDGLDMVEPTHYMPLPELPAP